MFAYLLAVQVEPSLDRAALLEDLRRSHGLDLSNLDFIPVGMVASYRAEGESGRFFLKVFPLSETGRAMAERLPAETALLRALRSKGVLAQVPRVVVARDGSSIASHAGMPYVVHEYIEGEALGSRWSEKAAPLGETIALLHAGTPRLKGTEFPVPPEDFGLPFERQMLDDLRSLETIGPTDRLGPRALRDLMLSRGEELLRVLEIAKGYQAKARSHTREHVACHTDAHGGNILIDPGGGLWLIDLETARLAPHEHDLWMWHAHLGAFLPAYDSTLGGSPELDPDLFAFYLYRRNLEDIATWMVQILHDRSSDEQHTHDLAELERFGIGWWPTLAGDAEKVRGVLAARR